jgi:hypothetical protein
MTPTITVSQSGGVTLAIEYQTNTTGFTGTTGSTDNAILRASGTGGSVIQGSLATIADDGTLDAPAITVDGDPVALKEATKRLFFPVAEFYPTAGDSSTALAIRENYVPASSQAYNVINFPEASTSAKSMSELDLVFPADADLSKDITFRILWRNAFYPTAGSVGWFLQSQAFDVLAGANPDTLSSIPNPPSFSSADSPVRYEDFVVNLAAPNTAFCRFRLYRQTPDSFSQNAYLIGACLTYNTL